MTIIGYEFNFFIVHFFRGCCSSMRQVGVGGGWMAVDGWEWACRRNGEEGRCGRELAE